MGRALPTLLLWAAVACTASDGPGAAEPRESSPTDTTTVLTTNPVYRPTETTDSTTTPALSGPTPYVKGDLRLSLDVFYEGDHSDIVSLGKGATYYIYDGTYQQEPTSDRVEGTVAHALEALEGAVFFGGGVTWNPTRDMSAWTTLHVSLKSEDPFFDDLELHLTDGDGNTSVVVAASHGFVADGDWHSLQVPLSEFALGGADLADVEAPFQLIVGGSEAGSTLLVDDVYITYELPPASPPLPGPDAFAAGDERLDLGLFYEGPSTERIPVDDTEAFFYLFDSTFLYADTSDGDRVEGLASTQFTVNGAQKYLGGGFFWNPVRDLTGWTRLRVSLKSSDASFDALRLQMFDGADGAVDAAAYGFVSDGRWHTLTIPLADFVSEGIDLSAVESPLTFICDAPAADAVLLVDNVYLDKE